MNRILSIAVIAVLLFTEVNSQTWTGTLSTAWNNAGNWSPAGIPTSTSVVTIPNAVVSNRWPALGANVVIKSISMSAGSQLDMNGFSVTIDNNSTYVSIAGTISNSQAASTDIVWNINTGGGGYNAQVSNTICTDSVIYNLTGTNQFIDGANNIYQQTVTYNINGPMQTDIVSGSGVQIGKNVKVERTVAGNTFMFGNGASIGGNFSYLNNIGGNSRMGHSLVKTAIAGKVDITVLSSTNEFVMYRLVNQTSGGNVNVQGTLAPDVQLDSLVVASFSITGYKGNAYAQFFNNQISGAVTLSDDATYSGGYNSQLMSNSFGSTFVFNLKGSNLLIEAGNTNSKNVYNGNATFNLQSSGAIRICHGDSSWFKTNLIVNRTVAGSTQAFNTGAKITGNFTYSNLVGGDSYLGNSNNRSTIGGMINITVQNSTPNDFEMYHLVNNSSGGNLNIAGTKAYRITNDTLLLNNFTIQDFTGNQYAWLAYNKITAAVSISDAASYSGGYNSSLSGNTIIGNTQIFLKGINTLFESSEANKANTYNGNTVFNVSGAGALYVSYADSSKFIGNITVNRSANGNTDVFNKGGFVSGNFVYNIQSNGSNEIGAMDSRTLINGTVNITVKNTSPSDFGMYRVINNTTGGSILLDSTKAFNIQRDTLLLSSITAANYYGGAYGYLYNNKITATLSFNDYVGYNGGYYISIRSNLFNGNCSFAIKGANNLYETQDANSKNVFNGNTSFTVSGTGALYLSHYDASQFNGNLSVLRTNGGVNYLFNAGPTVTGNFLYTVSADAASYLGNLSNKTLITGTMNVNVKNASPQEFNMYRIINLTSGGDLQLDSTRAFDFRNDTLKLAGFTCKNYFGGQYARLYNNDITAAISVYDDASYGGGYTTTLLNNKFTGNSTFTVKGSNNLREAADGAVSAGYYIGNTSFIMQGSGQLYLCHEAASQFNGNLSVDRSTTPSHTQVFNAGATITGNFSFNNNIGGNCYLGNIGVLTSIAGQVSIIANDVAGAADFQVLHLKNNTGGGVVSIQNTKAFNFNADTLNVASFAISNYHTGQYAVFYNNTITAPDFSISDAADYGGGYHTQLRDNVINGNSVLTLNGSNNFYDASGGTKGNSYNGNVKFVRNGSGIMYLGDDFASETSGDFNITGDANISIRNFKFIGAQPTLVSATGNMPIVINNLFLNKTGTGKITLDDSVRVAASATFTGGVVVSALQKELIFQDNATQTNASDASHVKGPVVKIGNDEFVFPVGNGDAIQTATLSAGSSVNDKFMVTYFDVSPHPTYDTSKRTGSLTNVSGAQYWMIERLLGNSNVTVKLEYGKPRGVMITANQADLRVARWDAGANNWQDLGNGGTTGSITEGTVITAAAVSNFSPFTIGGASNINPMSNTASPLASPSCANTSINIPFITSGVFNTGNVFTAQLSNASGSFANPINIGSVILSPNGINVANNVNAYLPSSLIATGTGYRIRIISSSPAHTGTANAANITINSLYVGQDTTVMLSCTGSTINLTQLYNTSGLTSSWNTANPTTAVAGNYRLAVVNGTGCKDTAFATVVLDVATWTGTQNNNWHNPQNWSTSKVPGVYTHVIILPGAPNQCVISEANATAASVQGRNGATFNIINNRQLLITGTCTTLPN